MRVPPNLIASYGAVLLLLLLICSMNVVRNVSATLDSCPRITINRYVDEAATNESVCTFTVAITGGDPTKTPSFDWSVTAGKIMSGQGTPTITIDVSEIGDEQLEIKLKVGDLIPDGCPDIEMLKVDVRKP